MAKKQLNISIKKRGPSMFPDLSEVAALLSLKPSEDILAMYSDDVHARSLLTRRINRVLSNEF